ncbi:SRPBCC family protein [Catenuloplanes japonicus]|uniref:SRPBCC family protein n=1 Tax=Catenuloplanes japonicus TaxID=33876 RepID=UPI0005271C10|nr:SRPBCC domain-containing protein [Catenuloplanes japonicus]
MSEYRIERDYPYPVEEVWAVFTEPELMRRWTTTGQGGRPEGFALVPGTRFRFIAKPTPGWRGIVDCEVLEVDAPHRLRYSWVGDEGGEATYVTYTLAPIPGGTRFTWHHTGFTGAGGFFMSTLLGTVRKKMLTKGVPAVLAAP